MRRKGISGVSQGDFDQLALSGLGQNWSGDFDQLSIAGVDYGEDYTKARHETKINTIEGVDYMYAQKSQLGCAYEMGTNPECMSGAADFGDHYSMGMSHHGHLGLVPMGMAGVPRGMGNKPYQMGEIPSGMGTMMETVKAQLTTSYYGVPAYMILGAAVAAFAFYQKSQGKKVFGF